MRKKLPALALACFLIFVAPLSVSAHKGRTDSNGGHTNHSTGEYHYHHGYPAHQHSDMDGDGILDCPYDFDDQTNHKSSSSSTPKESTPATEATKSASNSNSKKEGNTLSMVGWVISFILGIALFASLSHNDTESRRSQEIIHGYDIAAKLQQDEYESEKDKLNRKVSYLASKVDEYKSLTNDLQSKLNECESELSHIKSISLCDNNESPDDKNLALSLQLEQKNSVIQQMSDDLKICKIICRIPKSVSFHPNGMPIFHNPDTSKPYGDWTVYINQKSGIYHLDYFCSPYSSECSHLFNVLGTDIRPCKKCASGRIHLSGIPLWYTNYLEIKPKAKELGFLSIALSADLDSSDSIQREDRSDFHF